MTICDRWRTAVHEAGHAAATVELGGRCSGIVLVVDGGAAHLESLHGDIKAFAIAAGPAAEYLASEHNAPEGPQATYEEIASSALPRDVDTDFAILCANADLKGCLRTTKSDDRRIAEWAIGGNESDPSSWERRAKFAHRVAAQIVDQNAAAIVHLARALFTNGRVTGPEIESILNSGS